MDPEDVNRCVGWGVRPPNWNYNEDDISDSDEEKEDQMDSQPHSISEMDQQEFARWVSMKWNLLQFGWNEAGL